MDKLLAEKIMSALSSLTEPLNDVAELIELIPDEEEKKSFRRGIATLMSYQYTELERPLICQYPELDPDAALQSTE